MFPVVEEAWNPGIMRRWQLVQSGQLPKQSEYGRQGVVRYNGTDDQGWLTVYAHRISGAREIEDIQQRLETLDAREGHANQERLVDYAIDIVDWPLFPFRLGMGLYTVSEPVGLYTLTDYYNWHNRRMSWQELIALCKSIVPAVASLHRRGIIHGNISAENICIDAGSHELHHAALEELPLVLACPYPFPQRLEYFPYTPAAFLVRTPEQIDPGPGSPGPRTDIRQLVTMFYRRLTGEWPFRLSATPSLQEIADAICDRKNFQLDRLPLGVQNVFARAVGIQRAGAPIVTVEAFGRETESAARQCLEDEARAPRSIFPLSQHASRRRVVQALAVATAASLVATTTIAVKSLQGGVPPRQPAPPPEAAGESLNTPGNRLTALLPLSGREFIAGNETGLLALYTLGRQRFLRSLQLAGASLKGMARSADGRFLVCYDRGGDVSQLDGQITKRVSKQARLSQEARALALLGSGILISDGALVRFFADALEKPWSPHMPAQRQYQGHVAPVTGLATISDDRVVSSSMDKTVRMWNAFSAQTLCSYRHTSEVLAVAATTGAGALLLASADRGGMVEIWVPQGKGVRIDGYQHRGAVNALAWSSDGRYLVSGGDDTLLSVYDVERGQLGQQYTRHREPVLAVACLDEDLVVSMSASEMYIWPIRQEQ